MELWIPITFAAAFLQNLRTALQQQLTSVLDATEASYVRFCYAVPFAWMYLAVLIWVGFRPPELSWDFGGHVLIGAVCQILGTVALIRSFQTRNFAVGTAYSKTETVQAALFAAVIMGESMNPVALTGILVSLLGVVLLSTPEGWRALLHLGPGPALWYGVGAGAGFGISAVLYRGAALSLPTGDFLVRASITLVAATTIQTVGMGVYLFLRNRNSLRLVGQVWKRGVWVGLAGMLASAGWFTAMTLERAAYVRALGQVELLFAFFVTLVIFREKVRMSELLGAAAVIFGLVLLLI
ncbi:MAG: EamA family transporter [Pseudomonadales bacterium]